MPLVYGLGGLLSVPSGALTGNGPPPEELIGQLGQQYFDFSTSPHTEYVFDGQFWSVGGVNSATPGSPGIVFLATDAEAVAETPSTPLMPIALQPSNLSAVFASPPPLGSTLPNSAVVTTLEVTGLATLDASANVATAGAPLNLGLDDSGDTINIGGGSVARLIKVGVGTGTHQIYLGQPVAGQDMLIASGDSLTINGIGGTLFRFGPSTTNGSITIGGTNQVGDIILGNSLSTSTVRIGEGPGNSTVTICEGSSSPNQVDICNASTNKAESVNVMCGDNFNGTQAFSLLNGANDGSSSQVSILSGALVSGSHSFDLFNGAASGGTLVANIFGSNSSITPGTLNLGTGAAGHAIQVGIGSDPCGVFINAGASSGINLDSGGNVAVSSPTTSVASPTAAATLNVRVGTSIFTGFTIMSGNLFDFTINNTFITTTSQILASVSSIDASGNVGSAGAVGVRKYAGSAVVSVINIGVGDLVPGDDIYVTLWILLT